MTINRKVHCDLYAAALDLKTLSSSFSRSQIFYHTDDLLHFIRCDVCFSSPTGIWSWRKCFEAQMLCHKFAVGQKVASAKLVATIKMQANYRASRPGTKTSVSHLRGWSDALKTEGLTTPHHNSSEARFLWLTNDLPGFFFSFCGFGIPPWCRGMCFAAANHSDRGTFSTWVAVISTGRDELMITAERHEIHPSSVEAICKMRSAHMDSSGLISVLFLQGWKRVF